MVRNSNLEHLWDIGMPKEKARDRALMYKPSVKKAEGGTTMSVPAKAPIGHLNMFAEPAGSPMKTFIPTADPKKLGSHTDVNISRWTPQTRLSIYEDLIKAGGLNGMTRDQWSQLKPEETVNYLPKGDFDYTIGNTANPGGIKYWSRTTVPSGARYFDTYAKEKARTKYPAPTTTTMRADGGLLKKKGLTKKQTAMLYNSDKRKDSSLRKPNEVPGSAEKNRSHRQ
jgi:hypothetical protein